MFSGLDLALALAPLYLGGSTSGDQIKGWKQIYTDRRGERIGQNRHDIKHICQGCACVFIGRPNKKYCSSKCKQR
jgi:hypothetical protein